MNFKQKTSLEDYLAFYKYHVLKNFMSPSKLIMVGVFGVMLIVAIIFGQTELKIGAAAIIVLSTLSFLRIQTSGKKIYEKDPESFEYNYKFDDVTVSFSTKDGKSSKMWSEFVKAYEDDLYIYIFTKSNKGLMFVKAQMPEEVLTFVKKKIDETINTNAFKKLITKK